jgi:hypothetical protein
MVGVTGQLQAAKGVLRQLVVDERIGDPAVLDSRWPSFVN